MSQQPKVLHRLAGLPLAAHVLRALAPLSPSRTVLVVGHGAAEVEATLGTGYGPDNALPVQYALQAEQLGTGHAALMAEPMLKGYHGPVLICTGDAPLLRSATLSALANRHRQAHATLTMLTAIAPDPAGYGRVVRDPEGNLLGVIEEKQASLTQRAISEINSGVYIFDSDWLWSNLRKVELNSQGEYYLTDLVGMAIRHAKANPSPRNAPAATKRGGVVTFTLDGLEETMGINSRSQLAEAEAIIQARLRQQWLYAGVTMLMPDSVYLGVDVHLEPDTVLYPGVILEGHTQVARGCVLGPNTHIIDSTLGEGCRVISSMIEGSTLDRGVTVGPYSHVRPRSHLGESVHLGNFAEVSRSTLGRGVRMGHMSFMGDAQVGEDTNIGAGTITANYDGEKKNPTTIGKDVFLGVDTMLRAPVQVGDGAHTGAGSVVTKDVPANSLVVGMPARVMKRYDSVAPSGEGSQEVKEG
ncbi:MAG: bifunctional UDP-N-acetylglucosamine diphosphorylase/glucosamine-1-phosphate N-acetyltransferase GlmU [Chloroflexota bacterium]|nr:bifunctional UDP-N-acetylglucosamine diphosphorylase/glucosamine-1-phosphate N-acetyltransferase GlmU [Chloroflexota bacterium]